MPIDIMRSTNAYYASWREHVEKQRQTRKRLQMELDDLEKRKRGSKIKKKTTPKTAESMRKEGYPKWAIGRRNKTMFSQFRRKRTNHKWTRPKKASKGKTAKAEANTSKNRAPRS